MTSPDLRFGDYFIHAQQTAQIDVTFCSGISAAVML